MTEKETIVVITTWLFMLWFIIKSIDDLMKGFDKIDQESANKKEDSSKSWNVHI